MVAVAAALAYAKSGALEHPGLRSFQGDCIPPPVRGSLMLVYGDAERVERVADKRATILDALRVVDTMAAGIERHAALVSVFVALSELAQGIADAAFKD